MSMVNGFKKIVFLWFCLKVSLILTKRGFIFSEITLTETHIKHNHTSTLITQIL